MSDEPKRPNGEQGDGQPLNNGENKGRDITTGRFMRGYAGRPKGARNKRSTVLATKLEASGVDPLEFLGSVVNGTVEGGADLALRVQAAGMLAPYVHAKLHPSRVHTISKPLDLPPLTCVTDANEQAGLLCAMAARGEIALEEAASLITMRRDFALAYSGTTLEDRLRQLEEQVMRPGARLS